MQLLSAWKDSLKLLLPKNCILFFGAVVLGIMRTYRTWLRMWWWLILVFGGMCMIYGFDNFMGYTDMLIIGFPPIGIVELIISREVSIQLSWSDLIEMVPLILYIVLFFTLYLSARPSLAQKTYRYYMAYVPHALWFIGLFFLAKKIISLVMKIVVCVLQGISDHWFLVKLFMGLIVELACLSIIVFTIFFLLDSSGSLRAFLRAILRAFIMTIGALPLMILFMTGFGASVLALIWIMHTLGLGSVWGVIYFMLLPVFISFFATLYTKRLYDNSALYLE